jgi:hypothetical protein
MMTLEQQLDALIAQHGLSSITLTRIAGTGYKVWGISAQANGFIGANTDDAGGGRPDTASDGLTMAIGQLNAQRAAPVVVAELEAA